MPSSTFSVSCTCGERYHADDASAGRRIRCRRCGREVVLRRLAPQRPAGTFGAGRRQVPGERRKRRRRRSVLGRLKRWLGGRRSHATLGLAPTVAERAVGALSWAYLAAACLLAVVLWAWGDAWWPATVLLFSGRWIFLLPLALLVPAALVVRRAPLLAPLLVGGLVVLGPVMGFRTGWRRWLPSPAGAHFRVVTLNTDGGELVLPRLDFLLKEWAADVVALQECGPALAAAAKEVQGWHEHDDGELCLLSRYPIREARAMDRTALERVKQGTSGIGGAGYVVRYAIDTPNGTVGVTNLHLETPRKGLEGLLGGFAWFDSRRLEENTVLRDIESDLARRWVNQGARPLLVVGDFNTPVESRIFRRRWGGLADAFSRVGFGLGMTKYNGWIRVRIDHVLTGAGWHADHVAVGPDVGSDHRPLIVDLTLERR